MHGPQWRAYELQCDHLSEYSGKKNVKRGTEKERDRDEKIG